ncbi:L-threonylcarbamoyladenylate synthase [Aspergillus thermomutatus]|uniref:Threonylcarbamoyl-AMP synthase n=1 Tax=Aspergillus thermomutatus TaxID=41047 RepID=A0A397FWE6_ASPTH|nr:uncharacterized protein CDV56_100335 [Aspergillus thermomutatus]RHZ43082.1 hypothetical protein CDV56_100335 [Aspergillus thermomutatus]
MANLQVTLSPVPPSPAQPISLPINIAIHNPANTPVTFLNWGTPFDPRATLLGVFQINDTSTNDPVPLDTIKFTRQLPPSRDDLVEIPAESSTERTVTIPRVPLEQGHEYAVQAKGIWHGIWECTRDEVTDAQLERLGEARGEFESERAVFKMQMGIDIPTDAARVLAVLSAGGTAIIPSSVGYGIVATDPLALQRIFTAKRRQPHKRHAVIGSYALHRELHVLPAEHAALVRLLAVDLNLPLGVIAPYRGDHPLMRKLDAETLAASSVDGTVAMLVNGGPFQEELVRVTAAAGMALLGSSANLTGQGTKTVVEEIEPEVREAADIVVDYGRVRDGWPRASSTMVDFERMRVVRFGACYEVIRDVVGRFAGLDWPEDPGRTALFSGRTDCL